MRPIAIIVIAQFCCTSLWFAGNAAVPGLARLQHRPPGFPAHLVSAVQLGFIGGTFLFALLNISDRFSPSRVFFTCALLAAGANLGLMASLNGAALLGTRALTGFLLAGIYPVGMKIAADYNPQGLGRSLGLLVGALVLGTALPQLLRAAGTFPGNYLLMATSALSLAGGALLLLTVPDGPYRRPAQRLRLTALFTGFRRPRFRAVAFGYFGHMWELYTFWAFVPAMLEEYGAGHGQALNVPLLAFGIIGIGSLACAGSGYLSGYVPAGRIAAAALLLSGLCCLLSPLALLYAPPWLLLCFLFFWGAVVVADSPMFSSLVAGSADADIRGTALTIVTCIGFAITIGSIQMMYALPDAWPPAYRYVLLAAGPVFGLVSMRGKGA